MSKFQMGEAENYFQKPLAMSAAMSDTLSIRCTTQTRARQMDEEKLAELRARVAAKKRQAEASKLLDELRGRDTPVDQVTYVSAKTLGNELGLSRIRIVQFIREGRIKARLASSGRGAMWAIHPEEAARFKAEYLANKIQVR